ncbi:hypothetical protein G3545_14030 [Starkeya sp. ORNL1]|uniref:hypothetical protein n=1 Tax=Starkeya sp. ORNL1 TaxID=2709380 RepID=UPI001462EAF8|nr:hypothetical protein [Starkeya sp. ORNL1]QJP14662.1 hypothetical protein G3545_14030 [Starkeya sp. ORNL1]
MVFILQRRSVGINHDNYFVMSGRAEVGHIWLAHGYDIWHWNIIGFRIHPLEVGPDHGVTRTREESMAQFAARLRAGLAYAGFREMEPGEMQIEDEKPAT